jgi:hypothetical protein
MSAYIKAGNRISLLPVTQYCALAGKLSEEHGAGRAAALSSAFHAREAGAPDAKAKLARLTPKELDTISTWQRPTDVSIVPAPGGKSQFSELVLTYDEALKEQPVGLTATGEFAESGDVVTCGTLDFAWVVDGVAYVADMKKSAWTTSGPDTLQLLAYGYAWAKKHGCRAFVVGLWIIEDAEWRWSPTVYELDSFDALDLWERIKYAALNVGTEASFGDHCRNCYGRLHCPEYTLPAAIAERFLTKDSVGAAVQEESGEKLLAMLEYAERIEPMIERIKEEAKERARRGAPVKRKGQVLKFIRCKGRESLNKAKLFAAIPSATAFIERGDDYDQCRWVKDKAGK